MDILFIHSNYPAQFVHLAQLLARDGKHRVIFLTNREDSDQYPLQNVQIRRFNPHREVSSNAHRYLQAMEGSVLRGQAVVRELLKLKKEGFTPRLVIFHAGNGLGLFVRQIFQRARLIAYVEWWFSDESNRWLKENYDFNDQLRSQMRNGVTLMELDQCDVAVTPTQWQLQQFPVQHQDKIKVIFDGIDTNFFRPGVVEGDLTLHEEVAGQPLVFSSERRILSYATRGMEPVRGFPEFMRMLPPLLERFGDLDVVIAGRDRAAYSYSAPGCDGSWKQWMLKELHSKCDTSRIYFTGLLNLGEYRQLLWRTNLHCYFSRPYITSWGLFQAVACGASLLLNQDPCVDYVLSREMASWADLDDQPGLLAQAIAVLDQPLHKKAPTLSADFSIASSIKSWELLLNSLL